MEAQTWTLRPFVRSSATEHVLGALRETIVGGVIPPGAQLRETAIAQLAGTGRGAVREAVRQLVQEGLVEHKLHRGAFVRVMSLADKLDVYTARTAIETGVARTVVNGAKPPDLSRLEVAYERVRASATVDDKPSGQLITADIDFHREFVRLAGSPRLDRGYETLAAETLILLRHHPPYPAIDYADSHSQILEALRECDVRTPELVAEHLRLSAELISEQLDRESDALLRAGEPAPADRRGRGMPAKSTSIAQPEEEHDAEEHR